MNLEDLINELDDIILAGWALPMTNGQCIVNRERVKELIQDIRLNMPNEIRQAKAVVSDKNEIVEKAKREAEEIIKRAKAEAEKLTSEAEITKLANVKAQELVTIAQTRIKEMRVSTNQYSENMLENLEEMLTKNLLEIKQTRQKLKNSVRSGS